MQALLRDLRPLRIAGWAILVTLTGLLAGASVVVLPPVVAVVFIALPGLMLLWTMPDLQTRADVLARWALIVSVVPNAIVPYYYTIILPGLPWINIRRLFLIVVLVAFTYAISSSSQLRARLMERFRSAKAVSYCILGLFVVQVLSSVTAMNVASSTQDTINWIITSYIPFLAVVMLLSKKDVLLIIRLFLFCVIFNCIVGMIETYLSHPFLYLALPESIRSQLVADNPKFAALMGSGGFRNGLYRASSTFVISLSWGEYSAMTAPFALLFTVAPPRGGDRLLGLVSLAAVLVSIFLSGSRGAYLAVFCGAALFFFIWGLRHARLKPASMAGGLTLVFYAMAIPAIVGAVMSVGTLHRTIIGGGAVQNSNEGRAIQWDQATPKILARPILGYGGTSSGIVVGFYPNGIENGPTVDSYALTLLVDYGIPGFLLFFGFIIAAISIGSQNALKSSGLAYDMMLALSASLAAFIAYRPFLSQKDNQLFMLLVVGLLIVLKSIVDLEKVASVRRPTAVRVNSYVD